MLDHELLRDEKILVLKPDGALQASDFEALARKIDPYIEEVGNLQGLLIQLAPPDLTLMSSLLSRPKPICTW